MRLFALVVLLSGCSSRPATFAGLPAVTWSARAVYADGTPVASAPIRISLLATGAGLFPPGSSDCGAGDPHAQAIQNVAVVTSPGGSFSLEAPMTGFVRATDETCPMPVDAAGNISRIDLRVQADADFSSCLPYCRLHAAETCYSDCAARGQKFVWATSLTAADLGSTQGIRFDTLGPPLAGAPASDPPLPDLQVNAAAAQGSLRITQDEFAASSCALQDACIGAPGLRTLVRFDGDIENLGKGDLRIGSPDNNPLFTWSACHNHFHLSNIMTFELLDQTGQPVAGDTGELVIHKPGFCVQGIVQVAGGSPDPYDCTNQGLASGWEDIYSSSLNCQWLDVTGVPGGDYLLHVTVNASRIFPESDFDNNSALIPLSLP